MICCLLVTTIVAMGQQIVGVVVDQSRQPVTQAAVVLQRADSSVVQVTTSDAQGRFRFEQQLTNYTLLIKHLAYQPLVISHAQTSTIDTLMLTERALALDEISITTQAPTMTVTRGGGLAFNAAELIKYSPATNALELLNEIPLLQKDEDDNYQLIGSSSTTLILNGKRTAMSEQQISDYLSTLDPSRVKQIVLNYNSPARTGVHGASISIETIRNRSEELAVTGLAKANVTTAHNVYASGSASLALSQKKWDLHATLAVGRPMKYTQYSSTTDHPLADGIHEISIERSSQQKAWTCGANVTFSRDLGDRGLLTAHWNLQDNHIAQQVPSLLLDNEKPWSHSDFEQDSKQLNNVGQIAYEVGNFSAGASYVRYKGDIDQQLQRITFDAPASLSSSAHQIIQVGNLYADMQHEWSLGTFGYGIDLNLHHASYTQHVSQQLTDPSQELSFDIPNKSYVDEQSYTAYLSWQQDLAENLSLSADLYVEYIKSVIDQAGEKHTQWEKVRLLPDLSLTYKLTPEHSLQLSVESFNHYPSYSQSAPTRSFTNDYIAIEGNPSLQSGFSYDIQLNYFWGSHLQAGVFANLLHNQISPFVILDTQTLVCTQQYNNIKRFNQYGVLLSGMHRFTPRIVTRAKITLTQQDAAFDYLSTPISIDRLVVAPSLTQTFLLGTHKTFTLQCSVNASNRKINHLYERNGYYSLNAAIVWKPYQTGWNITLQGNDLLHTDEIHQSCYLPMIDSQAYTYADRRKLSLTVTYNWGNYKDKKIQKVDTSRLDLEQ